MISEETLGPQRPVRVHGGAARDQEPMNVTFRCHRCEEASRVDVAPQDASLVCPQCGQKYQMPGDAMADGRLERCVVCPSRDLFVRKDFPQRLGVAIVVVGFALSSVAWFYHRPGLTFAVLSATVVIDIAFYLIMPSAVMCYGCGAQYRHLHGVEEYQPFSLETHERHRQQAARQQEVQQQAARRASITDS